MGIHNSNYEPIVGDKCRKSYPGVIIVGVAKAGTAELTYLIGMHPQINIYCPIKENRDNSRTIKLMAPSAHFRTRTERLKQYMPCTYSDQVSSVKKDFTFLDPDMPKLINQISKRMKIIAVVREPIVRLYSQQTYWSQELNRSIEKIFNTTEDGQRVVNTNAKAVQASIYSECLKRYLQYFPSQQILIIEAMELKTDPVSVFDRVQTFLGVRLFDVEPHLIRNNNTGFYCFKESASSKNAACFDRSRGRKPTNNTSVSEADTNILVNFFRPYNEELFQIIQKRYEHW